MILLHAQYERVTSTYMHAMVIMVEYVYPVAISMLLSDIDDAGNGGVLRHTANQDVCARAPGPSYIISKVHAIWQQLR